MTEITAELLVDRPATDRRYALIYFNRGGYEDTRLEFTSALTRLEMLGKLAVPQASLEGGCVVLSRDETGTAPVDAWQPEWHYCRHRWNGTGSE